MSNGRQSSCSLKVINWIHLGCITRKIRKLIPVISQVFMHYTSWPSCWNQWDILLTMYFCIILYLFVWDMMAKNSGYPTKTWNILKKLGISQNNHWHLQSPVFNRPDHRAHWRCAAVAALEDPQAARHFRPWRFARFGGRVTRADVSPGTCNGNITIG